MAEVEWHGDFPFAPGEARRWRLGPLDLAVRRLDAEWRVAADHPRPFADDTLEVEPVADIPEALATKTTRWAVGRTEAPLTVALALSPLPVVALPETPFVMPAGARLTAFLGTPVWLALRDGAGHALGEVAVQPLRRTWFGPSPVRGEICHASRTRLRLEPSALVRRPWRATTPVLLANRGDAPLPVERVRLPLPALDLYRDAGGRLWTEPVALDAEDGGLARVSRQGGPPPEAAGAALVARARHPALDEGLVHAIGGWFTAGQ